MRGLLSAYRRSPAGGGLVLVLAAAVTVLLAGPKQDETPGIVVIAVVVAIVAVQIAGARLGRGRRRAVEGAGPEITDPARAAREDPAGRDPRPPG